MESSPAQWRLLLSGTGMFLFFGLLPSQPPLMYDKTLFPGTRHMITLHLEATQNGLMLLVMALLLPFLELSSIYAFVYEVTANLGAWMNVIPWLYGAVTGAVLVIGDGQKAGNLESSHAPPANNEALSAQIGLMLGICSIGDIVSWAIVLIALLAKVGKAATPVKGKEKAT